MNQPEKIKSTDIKNKTFAEFFKKKKTIVILCLIILIGAYFRLSGFHDLLRFNADQVRDAKIVDAMFEKNDFPLLGPKAGGTGFKLGPAFYYMEYVSGLIFGNSPAGIASFIPILAIFSIPLLFLLLSFYFPRHISLALTFLYAISFYAIRYSRFAWNPNVIFFFLFLFLISLFKIIEEKKVQKFNRWNFFLALSVGIGIQLHTTLLILMPVLFVATYAYIFLRNKKIIIVNFLSVLGIIIFLNIPFLAHDIINNGSNIKSFFEGTQKKTEKNNSFSENILTSGQFLVQGNFYALSGFEPQRNWLNAKKLLSSRDLKEIASATAGSAFLVIGIITALWLFGKEPDEKKKKFLGLILTFVSASFILFIPLANELNLRFFVILIFLPLILLGMLMMMAEKWLKNLSAYPLFTIILIAISIPNIYYYYKTYDLENYKARSSAYGGISLGETERISQFILDTSKNEAGAGNGLYLLPFEFERSLDFINQKSNISVADFSANKTPDESITFLIVEKKDTDKALEKQPSFFSPIDSRNIGRFTVFALRYEAPVKIGFLTDLHAKRGGAKKNFILNSETDSMLKYFINHMNNEFQPDFVVQGGDLVEGTNRNGQKSIDDFTLMSSYFSNLKMPFYNVIGNHEMRGLSKKEWLGLVGQKKSYYYFDYEGLRVIFLDGNENEEIGKEDQFGYLLSESQLQWTEKIISEETALKKIVFIHYPIINKNASPGDKIIETNQASRLKKMFSENRVAAVFSGHVEKLEMDTVDGVDYFIIPGLERSKNKNVLWLDSFADITIGKKAQINFYYKKNPAQDYKSLKIPSKEYEEIEK